MPAFVPAFITAEVMPIGQLFAGQVRLSLPWFQRAYAWTDVHAQRLISDLTEAMTGDKRRYWLGHVFLARPKGTVEASLIDGHQRSITLTILFAVLRDLATDAGVKRRLDAAINGAAGAHFTPQPGLQALFVELVQSPGATLREPAGDIGDLPEDARNVLGNRTIIRDMILDALPDAASQARFATFLLDDCYVTVETVEDEDEAWTLISTEEETGLRFHSSELLKLSLITAMPRQDQEAASQLYQRALALVGADGMTSLLSHIRTLKVKRRSSKPVEKDLLQRFTINRPGAGLAFMRDEVTRRAAMMDRVLRCDVGTGAAQAACARSLQALHWLDHDKWMAPALAWLASRGVEDAETPLFFQHLDRLAHILKIATIDPTEQETRFIRLVQDVDRKLAVRDMSALQIEPKLKSQMLASLRAPKFYAKKCHRIVLRRLTTLVAPDAAPVLDRNAVLPSPSSMCCRGGRRRVGRGGSGTRRRQPCRSAATGSATWFWCRWSSTRSWMAVPTTTSAGSSPDRAMRSPRPPSATMRRGSRRTSTSAARD